MNPRIVCSDDASVIAVQQPKKVNWENFPITFDVFVFIKDRFGRWSKHQINHPDVHVEPGLTLTRDGKKLLWVPDPQYSSAEAMQMK
ncbi:hypothetical protein GF373_13565 [bacterium]|nr:hypothetical protein [bacterium]